MRTVVMDDVVLSAEQVRVLKTLGELVVFRGTPVTREEILGRAAGAQVLISGWTRYSRAILGELPGLELISLWSTGMDCVDLGAARQAGVQVANVPGFARNAVAELTFGLILSVMRKIQPALSRLKASRTFEWGLFEGRELAGKTLGILGTGAIGAKAAQIARGFDMEVIAFDVKPRWELQTSGLLTYVGFSEAFSGSDIVSVHMPLLEETRGSIGLAELSRMPPHGVFINTARAEIVDQEALAHCLGNGTLMGAGLDDVDLGHPSWEILCRMEHVVMTPHMGFYTQEAVQVKSGVCVDNVVRFVADRADGGFRPAVSCPGSGGPSAGQGS
jgi:lactate dehydrogenase-like 2-hydroxyacid dehydrogenase